MCFFSQAQTNISEDHEHNKFSFSQNNLSEARENFFRIFGVTEVFEISRLLQIVLFLTDSVFFALCAYFDGSMVFFDEFLP